MRTLYFVRVEAENCPPSTTTGCIFFSKVNLSDFYSYNKFLQRNRVGLTLTKETALRITPRTTKCM
jgi:hypothetical protein